MGSEGSELEIAMTHPYTHGEDPTPTPKIPPPPLLSAPSRLFPSPL